MMVMYQFISPTKVLLTLGRRLSVFAYPDALCQRMVVNQEVQGRVTFM